MKHIFFLHSNICVISTYSIIKELICKGKEVVVLTNRNTTYPYFKGQVSVCDLQIITDRFRKQSKNVIDKFFNYKFQYLPKFKAIYDDIIDSTEFILYTPSYNMLMQHPLVDSPYCKGYYYIEEGTNSYLPLKYLHKIYITRLLKGHILLTLFGIGERFDYKQTSKFKGVICISPLAFPWCNHKKILNDPICYFKESVEIISDEECDSLIVTSYLQEEIGEINKGLKTSIDAILQCNPNSKIGIKIHPKASSYEKDKVLYMMEYIKNNYPSGKILFLPRDFSVEKALFSTPVNIYTLFGMSSLAIYSIAFNRIPHILEPPPSYNIVELHSIDDCIRAFTKYNY